MNLSTITLLGSWYCLVDMYRCSVNSLLCGVDAGRGIQGRGGSQRWQDAQLQLGYHCRCGQPAVAEGQGLEGGQADPPASGTPSTASFVNDFFWLSTYIIIIE